MYNESVVLKYRKKPVEVFAVRLERENVAEVAAWVGCTGSVNPVRLQIKTLEGVMTANEGDFIIKGLAGEFYPCKADIFLESYDRV